MEQFTPIVHNDVKDNYDISDAGRVRNRTSGRILKQSKTKNGYPTVSMMRPNGKPITKIVHRLVALAFIPNPANLRDVNHRDGQKANNSVSNLEWISHSDNILHAQQLGLKKDEKPVISVHVTTGDKQIFRSSAEAARAFGSHRGNINGVLKGRYGSHKGHYFYYVEENITQDEHK